MHATKMSVYKSLSGKTLRKTRRINSYLKLFLTLIPPTVMRNGHIAAASWLVRNTLDGCQATNKITDTGFPRSRESGGLVYLSY